MKNGFLRSISAMAIGLAVAQGLAAQADDADAIEPAYGDLNA